MRCAVLCATPLGVQISVVLENNRVEYKPSMINLTQMVNIVSKEVISVIAVVPRLEVRRL